MDVPHQGDGQPLSAERGAYQQNWQSDVDRVMMKSRLQLMAELHHRGLVLSEFAVKDGRMSQLEKAAAYIEILR
ncbi:MAG: hypothetical protein WCD37_18665 [Chloroflexia bacterium]